MVPVVPTAAGAPADALVDRAGAVARRYGLGDDGIALVRPDGYLGLVATAAGEDRALADHLSRALHVGGVPA